MRYQKLKDESSLLYLLSCKKNDKALIKKFQAKIETYYEYKIIIVII